MSKTRIWTDEELRHWNTETLPKNLPTQLETNCYYYYVATFQQRNRIMEVKHDYIDVSIRTGSRLFAPSDYLIEQPFVEEQFLQQYRQELRESFQNRRAFWKMYLATPVLIFLGADTEQENFYRRELANIFVAFHHRDKQEAAYCGQINAKHL